MAGLVTRLEQLFHLARTEPQAAAAELRAMAAKLNAAAATLERRGAEQTRSTGSLADRVQINVVGPDSVVKQSVDTQECKS